MAMPLGNYIIYNRVLSPAGEKLAITFNGNNQLATVKPLVDGDASQQWTIGQPTGSLHAQPISPVSSPSFQAGSSDGVKILPGAGYVWVIQSGDAGYSIQNGNKTYDWNLSSATVGSKVDIDVTPSDGSEPEKYRWIVQRL